MSRRASSPRSPAAASLLAALAAVTLVAVTLAAVTLAPASLRAGDRNDSRAPRGFRSLYDSEPMEEKKLKANDLILILVEENGFAANNSNINLRRKFDLQAEVKDFPHFEASEFTLTKGNPANLPKLNIQSEKRQEGRGTTDRREKIVFKIAARVIEVQPNGNLIVEARKTRRINDEESILTLFGEVSPDDVHPFQRTVRSERIADMKLVYSGHGPVSRNLGRTIISWLAEWLWPF